MQNHSRQAWSRFVNTENQHLVSSEALDLLVSCVRGVWVERGWM